MQGIKASIWVKDFVTEEELELDDDLCNDDRLDMLVDEDQLSGGMQGFIQGYRDAF